MNILVRVGAWFCGAHFVMLEEWNRRGEDRSKTAVCGVVGERGTRWNELSKEATGNICKECRKAVKGTVFEIREKSSEWEQST